MYMGGIDEVVSRGPGSIVNVGATGGATPGRA